MINLITSKSCCGSKALIAETVRAVKKSSTNIFKDAGYFVPDNFFNSGIFYVNKNNLTATAAFGATKISIRCGGNDCAEQVEEFVALLEQVDGL